MSEKRYFTLEKKQLKERIKYNFCPYCWKELKSTGVLEDKIIKAPETLGTMFYVKVLVKEKTEQGGEISYVEESYQCGRCHKKNITVDDFEKTYCKPYVVPER